MLEVEELPGAVRFSVRVQPRASRNAVDGEWQGALKVRLTAAPVDGKANEALSEFLSGLLKIPKSAVRILSGERSRIKRLELRGVSARQVHDLLVEEA